MLIDGKLEIHLFRGNTEGYDKDLWSWEIDLPAENIEILNESEEFYSNPFQALFEAIEYLKLHHITEYTKLELQSFKADELNKAFNWFTNYKTNKRVMDKPLLLEEKGEEDEFKFDDEETRGQDSVF